MKKILSLGLLTSRLPHWTDAQICAGKQHKTAKVTAEASAMNSTAQEFGLEWKCAL